MALCQGPGESLRFGELELRTFDAAYTRFANFPMPLLVPGKSLQDSTEETLDLRETGSLLNAIIREIAGRIPMINPPDSHRFHNLKPLLYRTLQAAGVPVPEFAVGCDLAAAAHFVDRHGENVVVKPLMGGEVFSADFAFLKEHHEVIDRRPLLLQRRIRGRSLRAYVVEASVVAVAEIVHGDVVDWRADTRDIVPVSPSLETEKWIREAARALALAFAGVDVEEDADGKPWVIDVNPAPMFASFEERTGLDISGPLAERLLTLASPTRLPTGEVP